MKLNAEKMYMNPHTGYVADGAEWMDGQKEIGFPESDLDDLVEVRQTVTEEEKDKWGEWMEVKD